MKKSWLWLSIVFVAALAACNGNNNNPNVNPTPGPTCQPPAGTQFSMVYPAPNSTAIPDQFGQIVIAASPALPSTWNLVTQTVTATVGGSPLATVNPPFPSPTASPSFANPTYQASTFNGIYQGEVVNVFLNNPQSNCTPLGIGSFTTQ